MCHILSRILFTFPNESTGLVFTKPVHGEGNGNPLQYSCLGNPTDGGAWWAAVHRVTKSQTWLTNFTFTFHSHALEKEMATRSSVLAWRIPGMGEPGGLPSLGSHRVRHNWSDLAAAAANQYTREIISLHYSFDLGVISPPHLSPSEFWMSETSLC